MMTHPQLIIGDALRIMQREQQQNDPTNDQERTMSKKADRAKPEASYTLEELRNMPLIDSEDGSFNPPVKEAAFEYERLMTYYRCAIRETETKFNVLNDYYAFAANRNPISRICSRLKSDESIFGKLKRRELPPTIAAIEDNLSDIAGIRVICSFPEDVYTVSNAFLQQDDIKLIERKDYIAQPKDNGYRSLHLIVEVPIFIADQKKMVRVEIQFRTIAMEFWAALEHDIRYKKDMKFTRKTARELAACAELSAMLDERMDALRKRVTKSS